MRVEPVPVERKIVVFKTENIGDVGVQCHCRQRIDLPLKLGIGLFDVIGIEMRISQRMDKFTGLQPRRLCHHQGQQGVGCNIERHAEEYIGAALIELAGKLSVRHVELEQAVTGWQRHRLDLRHVPRTHDQAARIRIGFDLVGDMRDLIDGRTVACVPGPPLRAVDRAQVAVLIGPLVPDRHTVVVQIRDIGIALQKPQKLVDDGFGVNLLGRDHRKPVGQVEPHLVAEHAVGARARAVVLPDAGFADTPHKIEILLHGSLFGPNSAR